jgi:hypothetical protein
MNRKKETENEQREGNRTENELNIFFSLTVDQALDQPHDRV